MHVIIDALSDGRLFRPGGIERVHAWLTATVEALGVTPLERRVLCPKGQIQAVQLIAESHIMLHAFQDGRVYLDIFSCTSFKEPVATRIAVGRLGLLSYRVQVLPQRLTAVLQERTNA